MIDETTPADQIPLDHIAYAALHRETQDLIKKLQSELADHVKDESNAFHDVTNIQARLDDGDARMGRIEDSIFANHLEAVTDRKAQSKLLEENTQVTKEIKELISAGKGFRKVIMWTVPMITVLVSFYYALIGHTK